MTVSADTGTETLSKILSIQKGSLSAKAVRTSTGVLHGLPVTSGNPQGDRPPVAPMQMSHIYYVQTALYGSLSL
jgi:hypothetical protein